jgi:acyl carrier protein
MNVAEKVKEIIADALYADVATIKEESGLITDLGAESIDFLDIVFRLEQEFSIKLPKGESEKKAREGLSDEDFAINGVLQAKGLERLREMMPEVSPDAIKPGLLEKDIPTLYTVGTFVRMVEERLQITVNKSETTIETVPTARPQATSRRV